MVRWGERLVHIEADDAGDAVQGSIEALRRLGDWTEDPGELRAFPYVEYGKHAGRRGFTRAVIDRARCHPGRTGTTQRADAGSGSVGGDTGAERPHTVGAASASRACAANPRHRCRDAGQRS